MFPVGVSKAKEALVFGKKLDANALLDCGFVKYVALSSPLYYPESLNLRFVQQNLPGTISGVLPQEC